MNKGQAKTGRKGDPRMHRAVAARMENPELSLFEALRVGGFDYPADEDASIMDAEKVTLGQRKNQLSRRLRLARKQQEEQGDTGNNNGMMDDSMGMGGMNGMNGLNTKMKLQQLQQQQNAHAAAAAAAAAASNSAMSSEAQRQLEKLMQHSQNAKLSSGVKRNAQLADLADAEIHPNDEDTGLMDEKNARRMAKFHPQYQPLFIPRAASVRNSFTGGTGSNLSAQISSQLTSTPQLGPLAAPLNTLGGPASTSSFAAAAAASNPSLFPSASGLLGQTSSLTQRRTNVAAPSGVAVASLSATAQSVGLSLEQLAVALSSSSNLVKVLSNNSGSEQQQELALRLFRNESRALYQRCMLLAGFRPEDAEEKSQNHLQFAFSAWQMEGKRLQELMGDDNGGSNSANNAASNPVSAAGPASMSNSGLNRNGNPNAMNNMISNQMEANDRQQHQLQQQQQQLQQQQQQLQQQAQQQAQQQQQQHHNHGHGHPHNENSNNNGHGQGHGHGHSHNENNNAVAGGSGSGGHDHAHEHGHSHEHQHNGHHIHQLEGKCGHKAIIHQPKDGSAHIDFVVGDKVECYHGIQPMGNKSMSVWPSKYKCEDLSCPPPCDEQQCDDEAPPVDLDMSTRAPKILDLSDIDLAGTEWNSDLNGSMGGTLLGLFKLGDSDDNDKGNGGSSQQGNSNSDGFGISV